MIYSFESLPELFCLLSIVFVLSMANHINYERAGLLSTIEQIAAKSLYVYGVVQLYRSPSLKTFITSFVCFLVTTSTFLVTLVFDLYHNNHRQWECCHPIGMHLAPSVWVVVTAMNHRPIFFE